MSGVSADFRGMEIQQAQQLVALLRSRVQDIHTLLVRLNRVYENCAWIGADREAFGRRLADFDRRMRSRTRQIEATAERLRSAIARQIATSR